MAKFAAMHIVLESGLRGYLGPKLAADQKIDLKPIVKGITGANFKAGKAKLAADIALAVKGKLAKDTQINDVSEMLDSLEDMAEEVATAIESKDDPDSEADEATAEDAEETDEEKEARLKKEKEEKEAADKKTASDAEAAAKKKEGEKKGMVSQAAMDSAIATATKVATDAAIQRMGAISEARALVAPYIGEIKGKVPDTAAGIIKLALDANHVDLKDVPESAYGAILKLVPKPQASNLHDVPRLPGSPPPVAQDAKGNTTALAKRFPESTHIKRRGG